MEYQSAAAEVTGEVIIRGHLSSGRTCEAQIAIESNKQFCVHSIGPLLDDTQGYTVSERAVVQVIRQVGLNQVRDVIAFVGYWRDSAMRCCSQASTSLSSQRELLPSLMGLGNSPS